MTKEEKIEELAMREASGYDIETVLEEAIQYGISIGREQHQNQISLILMAIETFMEEDIKEYGEIPLHGKFKAFMGKYLSALNPTGEEQK